MRETAESAPDGPVSDYAQATSEGPGDGRRQRWAEHRTQRRAAFVRAGVEAIDRYGPAASAEQIAVTAGVSRTVLYRYFKDKDDLGEAIAEQMVDAVIGSVLPHLVLTTLSTPRKIITPTVATIIGLYDEHPNFYLFLRERRNEKSLSAVEATLAGRISYLLQALMAWFGMEGDEAEPTAYGIVGFVESSCAWWLSRRDHPTAMSRERFTDMVCDSVWRLLEGQARANGMTLGFDDPLPVDGAVGTARPAGTAGTGER